MNTYRAYRYVPAGVIVVAMLLFPLLADEVCTSDFVVANHYHQSAEVWVYGEDGDWAFLGTVRSHESVSFTHRYVSHHGEGSHCDRCRHRTTIQYRVPSSYSDAGALLCEDTFTIDPCHEAHSDFRGPNNCGAPHRH